MSALEEYRKYTQIADEILSEQYATTLKVASVPREYADDAIAKLEAEVKRLAKQRDRAEAKYDALLAQLPKSQDYEFEVFDAPDGVPSLRMVSYKDRADRAEALLRYVLTQDMEYGDRGREPLDGLIERLGAELDAANRRQGAHLDEIHRLEDELRDEREGRGWKRGKA